MTLGGNTPGGELVPLVEFEVTGGNKVEEGLRVVVVVRRVVVVVRLVVRLVVALK